MFIDHAKIFVKAGSGGKGCRSFYRDKYVRDGVPDGGNGGNGGDVIIRTDRNLFTLLDFKYNRHFQAQNGGHGSGKKKRGKDAPALIVRVPPGTLVVDEATQCVLRDLAHDAEEFVVAKGGAGGLGNTPRRDEPTPSEPGEERFIILDLKLIADVGVIGFPNVGKSTLISAVSNAHSQVGGYHFTTKAPVLGVVQASDKRFIMADMPGLIEGASEGRGLGDKFLRHIERTRVLVHLIDMASSEGRDPVKDYRVINAELHKYSPQVARKPQIIAANKMDMDGAEAQLRRFLKAVKKKVYPISALRKTGLEAFIEAVSTKV